MMVNNSTNINKANNHSEIIYIFVLAFCPGCKGIMGDYLHLYINQNTNLYHIVVHSNSIITFSILLMLILIVLNYLNYFLNKNNKIKNGALKLIGPNIWL